MFHLRIDIEVCEQTFSWLSKYAKTTRKINRGHFVFFIIMFSIDITLEERKHYETAVDIWLDLTMIKVEAY